MREVYTVDGYALHRRQIRSDWDRAQFLGNPDPLVLLLCAGCVDAVADGTAVRTRR